MRLAVFSFLQLEAALVHMCPLKTEMSFPEFSITRTVFNQQEKMFALFLTSDPACISLWSLAESLSGAHFWHEHSCFYLETGVITKK